MPVLEGTVYTMDVYLNYAEHKLDVQQQVDYTNVTSETLALISYLNVHPNRWQKDNSTESGWTWTANWSNAFFFFFFFFDEDDVNIHCGSDKYKGDSVLPPNWPLKDDKKAQVPMASSM